MSTDALQPSLRACPLLSDVKFKYRTKFEVVACEWNPAMELLALASRKGEVVVKRCGWKTGWKRDFSKDASLRRWRELFLSDSKETGDSSSRENALTTICWSPDGQCLAVAFDSGRVYFLDAQNGRSLCAKRFENKPIRLKWIKLVGEEPVPRRPAVPPADAFAALDTSSTKEHAAQMADLEAFISRMLPDSLHNTMLLASSSTDTAIVIDLYAGGLLHLARLDTTTLQSLTANSLLIDPTSVELLDFGLGASDHLHAVVKYCAQSREGGGYGWFTSALRWRLGIVGRRHEIRLVMSAMQSLAEMSYCSAYVREMFEVVSHDWKAQSEAFHQRVLSNLIPSSPCIAHSLQPYQDFFLLLTTGRVPESMREYLQNDSTLKDLKLAAGFVDNYPLLTKAISTRLRPTVEYFGCALVTFKSAVVNLFELVAEGRENSALRFLRTLQKIQKHNKAMAKGVINWELEECTEAEKQLLLVIDRLQSALESLTALLTDMERIADENREELSELLRWLSNQCAKLVKELEDGGGDGENGEKEERVDEDTKTDPTEQQLRLVKFFSKASGLYPSSSNHLRNELDFLDAWRSQTLSAQTVAAPLQLDRVLPLVAESFPSAMRECMSPLLELFHNGIHTTMDGELGGTSEIVHVETLHPEGPSTSHLLFSGIGSSQFLATLQTAGSVLSFYRVGHSPGGVAECVKTINGGVGIKVLDQSLQPSNDSASLFGLLEARGGGEESTEGPFVFRASVIGDTELEVDLTSNLLESPAYVKIGSRLALMMDASRDKLVWATLNDAIKIDKGEVGNNHRHCGEVNME